MTVRIFVGDVRERLKELPDESVHCVVTSPPYWGLRDYGVEGQIGLEEDFGAYLEGMVEVFGDVRRVLRADGTLWLNMGDCYSAGTTSPRKPTTAGKHGYWENPAIAKRVNGASAGLKPKDLMGMPWRLAFALQADGWWLRRDIIWSKPNPMPESTRDRPTTAHEYMFLLSKSERYFYDADAVREARTSDEDAVEFRGGSYVGGEPGKRTVVGNKRIKVPGGWDTKPGAHGTINRQGRTEAEYRERGVPPRHAQYESSDRSSLDDVGRGEGRNLRSVWTIATAPFPEAHFATFPPALVEPCIKAGCPANGTVLDPFGGAGTTGLVADRLGRDAILIELNPEYAEIARRRINGDAGMFSAVEIDRAEAR